MQPSVTPLLPGEAVLRYRDATYDILRDGSFVRCAVTGRRIPLAALRYWSVDRQEAYADIAAATTHILRGEAP